MWNLYNSKKHKHVLSLILLRNTPFSIIFFSILAHEYNEYKRLLGDVVTITQRCSLITGALQPFIMIRKCTNVLNINAAWKVTKYRVISGPYFPVFGLITEIYSVNLRIQSQCRKIQTRKTPNTATFHA